MCGWMDLGEWINECVDGWMDGWNGWIGGLIGWIDECADGWMD